MVREAIKFAKNHVIENGPILIELSTYRYHGHSMSDPGVTYRSKDEVQSIRKTRDPIEIVRNMLLDQGWAEEKELKDYEKKVRADIDNDVKKILADPFPAPEELYTEIQQSKPYVRGVEYKLSQLDYN